MKRALSLTGLVLALASPMLTMAGCGDDCDAAIDLCEECELDIDGCARFERATAEDCSAAVATFEASCPES